jgi:hypothetical protein
LFDLPGMTSLETPLNGRICLRPKTIFSKAFKPICRASPHEKLFLFLFFRNYDYHVTSASIRGAFRDRHERSVRDAVGVSCCSVVSMRTNNMTRTAKSCGPGIPTLFCCTRVRPAPGLLCALYLEEGEIFGR